MKFHPVVLTKWEVSMADWSMTRMRWRVNVYRDGKIGVLLQTPHWKNPGEWSNMWGGVHRTWDGVLKLVGRIEMPVSVTWQEGSSIGAPVRR
jgi:hypothetical protein